MATPVAQTSEFILDKVGGAENISSLTHCATRLRFQLNDQSKADQEALDANPDVLGVVAQGTNGLQVVMGGGVADYYKGIMSHPSMSAFDSGEAKAKPVSKDKKEYGGVRAKFGWVDYCFEFLSDTFRPLLWALLGASLILTLLVLADTFGWQDFRTEDQPPVYALLHAAADSVFYFLPIMVGATASKKLGANEWVGAAIPAALLTPAFTRLGGRGDVLDVHGIPLYLNDYSSQVFPPILAAIALYFLEKLLKKIIPTSVQMVFVPFFCLLILVPLAAFVIGPVGIIIGNGISSFLYMLYDFSPFALSIVVPMLYPFLVPLGLHWPLNVIMIQNIGTLGFDFIQGPMGAWNFAAFGVAAAVLFISIREGNQSMKQISMGSLMAGLLGGISEPTLYGIILRFKRTYPPLLIGCFVGGFVSGCFGIIAKAFVFTSLLTIPAMEPMIGYALSIAAAFFTTFFLILFLDYRTPEEKAAVREQVAAQEVKDAIEEDDPEVVVEEVIVTETPGGASGVATAVKPVKTALESGAVTTLTSPIIGQAVPLSEVPDPIFAAAKLGEGIAINPTGTDVIAPAAGSIITVQSSGHAVGLRLDSGIDLLIHVGIDTVQLNGEGFTVHVEKKQRVEPGDKLISFDPDFIKSQGYNMITPVLVTNTRKFASVEGYPAESVNYDSPVITTTAKVKEAE